MEKRSSVARQLLPHGVMLAASGWLWWAASRIEGGTGGRIGPDVWPKAIVAIMALLCIYELGKRLFARRGAAPGLVAALVRAPGEGDPAQAAPFDGRKLGAGIALVAAYVAAVSWTGFFLTTALFLALFAWAGGLRRPVLVGTVALAGSLLLIVLFMRVAYISLPLGEGPFRSLSLALLRAIGVS